MRSLMRREDGQSSAEYLGMLVLVALIIGSLVMANPNLGRQVTESVLATICRITGGGDCGGPQVAGGGNPWDPGNDCVVSTVGGGANISVDVAFFTIGQGLHAMLSENADGTYDVTFVHDYEAGVTTGAGGSAGLIIGDLNLSGDLSAGAQAALFAELGTTHTYANLQDAQIAMIFEAYENGAQAMGPLPGFIAQGVTSLAELIPGIDRPEPISSSESGTAGLELSGGAAATLGGHGAELEAALGGSIGATVNDDGSFSTTVGVDFGANGHLSQAQLGELSGAFEGAVAITYDFDPNGNLTNVTFTGEADIAGTAQWSDWLDGNPNLTSIVGDPTQGNDSDRYVIEASVDVSNNPEGQQAFIDLAAGAGQAATGNPAGGALVAGAAPTIADLFANESVIAASHYSESSFPVEAWFNIGALAEVGLSLGGEFTQSDLQAAAFYDRDEGQWVPWTSCTGG